MLLRTIVLNGLEGFIKEHTYLLTYIFFFFVTFRTQLIT